MREPKNLPPLTAAAAEREIRCLTRRGFVTGAVAGLAGLGTWGWLMTATREDGLPWPLRRVLRFNQELAERLGPPNQQAPTFPTDSVEGSARTNGLIGLSGNVDSAGWELSVAHEGRGPGKAIRLRDIQELPRVDLVTELKCVEGWSEVMHFGGVRFLDFVAGSAWRRAAAAPPTPRATRRTCTATSTSRRQTRTITSAWTWPVLCTRRRCCVTR